MKNKIFLFLTVVFSIQLTAQNRIDSVLFSVSKNNKSIQTAQQFWKSQSLSFKTGSTLYDPTVNFDYMRGSPATAGNQVDFTVTQSFDFPTVYANKKQLYTAQIGQGDYQIQVLRQTILLEAHLVCIELIYLNKLKSNLLLRLNHAQKIYDDYNVKLEKGEGNIIEFNKSKINLFNLQNELRLNQGEINGWMQKLTELNGGNAIEFKDTLYPFLEELPSFEELEQLSEITDPYLKNLEQQSLIANQKIDLNKSLWLPKWETGYHYQAILGQQFNGVHVGLTVPLWQNKYTVAQSEAESIFTQTQIDEHRTSHYYEIKLLYENYLSLKLSYKDYMDLIGSLSSVEMLDKAMKAGQITVIEFFMELSSYYVTYDNLLKIEKEYFTVVAKLNKYLM